MALFGGKKSGVTDADRLRVMELATDEDYTLFEVASRFHDLANARLVVAELLAQRMVELHIYGKNRNTKVESSDEVHRLLDRDDSWAKATPGRDKYLVLATDIGWRWHQKHWKAT